MKIRNGFVSNSSSSSFVIFGIKTKVKDITPKMLKEKNYIVIGDAELQDGLDVFNLENEEMLNFIKACEKIYGEFSLPFTIYENFGKGRIDLSKLPKKGFAELRGGECDQHSSYNLESLFENYCGDYYNNEPLDRNKIELEMEKFQRKEKIVEIEKNKF